MILRPLGLSFLMFCSTVPAQQAAEPNAAYAPEEAARWSMACRSAARQLVEEVDQLQQPTEAEQTAATEALVSAIRTNPGPHQKRSASKELCVPILAKLYRAQIKAVLQRALDRANAQTKKTVRATDVTKLATDNWSTYTHQAEARFIATHLDSQFYQARERAVALSKHDTDKLITYPPFTRLDKKLQQLAQKSSAPDGLLTDTEFDQLTHWLKPYAGQVKGPQLEEISDYVSDTAARLRDEIRSIYTQQTEALSALLKPDTLPKHLLTAPQIQDWVLAQWSNKPMSKDISYGLFGALHPYLKQHASDAEAQLLKQFLQTQAPPTTQADLETRMKAKPEAYITFSDSKEELLRQLQAEWTPKVVDSYVQAHPGDAQTKAHKHLLSSPVLEREILHNLDTFLPAARETLKEEQVRTYFNGFFPLTPFSNTMLEWYLDQYNGRPVTTLKSAYLLLSLDHPKWTPPLPDTPFLEETREFILASINQRAQQSVDVLKQQQHLLRLMEKSEMPELEQAVAEDTPVQKIIDQWRKKLTQQWVDTSTDSEYPHLLQHTLNELNKTVRQLYDSQRSEAVETPTAPPPAPVANIEIQEAHQEETPSERKPEPTSEPPPEEAPPLEKTEQLAILAANKQAQGVLLLTDTETDQCRVQLLDLNGSEEGEFFIPLLGSDSWENKKERLGKTLSPLLESQLETWTSARGGFLGLGSKPAPRLLLYIHADSRDVRYRAILQLRREMETFVNSWLQQQAPDLPPAEIIWIAGTE